MRTALDHNCRGALKGKKWVLCIGAGVNKGLLPDWNELARRLVSDSFGMELTPSEFQRSFASVGWGADSWIQAALNHHVKNDLDVTNFLDKLEQNLYFDLLAKARTLGLESAVVHALNARSHLKRPEVTQVLDFFSSFKHASVIQIADIIIEAMEKDQAPSAIINFNADPILFAILSLKLLQRDLNKNSANKNGVSITSPQAFRPVGRPDQFSGDGIPIFHVHGSLFPPSDRTKTKRRRDSRDFLIFPEISYHKMAGNLASWPQATYLFFAHTHDFLFAGLSLADSNIRRWMGWKHEAQSQARLERVKSDPELAQKAQKQMPRRDYWIRTVGQDEFSNRFFDSALDHLGIEALGIGNWSELPAGMRNLLSLKQPKVS